MSLRFAVEEKTVSRNSATSAGSDEDFSGGEDVDLIFSADEGGVGGGSNPIIG